MSLRSVARDWVFSKNLKVLDWMVKCYLIVEATAFSLWCRVNYALVYRRLRRKARHSKLKVMFIVSEPAKWKCQSLYEKLNQSDAFEAVVGLSAWNCQSDLSDDELDEHLKKAEAFFDRLGDRHVRTVLTHPRSFVPLTHFKPVIIFYNEQWRPCFAQHPVVVSRFALTFFIPYYVPVFGNMFIHCQQPVEQLSYVYFTLNKDWEMMFAPCFNPITSVAKFMSLGYPALDSFSLLNKEIENKGYVIYAPHFAIPPRSCKNKTDWQITQSTFDWNGGYILQYAKKHPEVKWIFKPHPLLRSHLAKAGFMTMRELDDYYEEWRKIGRVCESGDYQELFLGSLAMLTDSGSFLAEYGATGKPLIHLWCTECTVDIPLPTRKLMDSFYRVTNKSELEAALVMLVEKRDDPKSDVRRKTVAELGLTRGNAAESMVRYLTGLLR